MDVTVDAKAKCAINWLSAWAVNNHMTINAKLIITITHKKIDKSFLL